MFCPKCGSILMPDKDKKRIKCSCGYTSNDINSINIKEKIKNNNKIDVVDKEEETLPITDTICPKCNNTKGYYWLVQTRAGDEPETKFMKCTKCKHRWRNYD